MPDTDTIATILADEGITVSPATETMNGVDGKKVHPGGLFANDGRGRLIGNMSADGHWAVGQRRGDELFVAAGFAAGDASQQRQVFELILIASVVWLLAEETTHA